MNEMTEKELVEGALEDEQAFQEGISKSIIDSAEFVEVPAKTEENPLGRSRIGVTKKIYREKAQHSATKKAKKQRAVNQSRKNKKRRPTGSKQRK